MSEKSYFNHYNRKILLIAISTIFLADSFLISSQSVQPSIAQDIGQLEEQIGEKIGGEIGQLTGGDENGNQTGNQTGNQSGDGVKQLAPLASDEAQPTIEEICPEDLVLDKQTGRCVFNKG